MTNGRSSIHAMPFFYHQVNPHVPVSFNRVNGELNRFPGKPKDALPNGQKLHPQKMQNVNSDKKNNEVSEHVFLPENNEQQGQIGYQGIEGVYTADSLLTMEIPENFWLVDQIILNGVINFLAGDSDCGKSSLLSQLGKEICNRSSEFIGHKINARNHSVIYVSTEDHPEGFSIKLKKQFSKVDDTSSEMMNYAFIFHTENILEQLNNLLQKQPADLIIIDAFADLVRGDLNSSSIVRFVLEGFRNLALKYRCAVILVHHTTKISQSRTATKNDLVGSQAITAFARQVLMLTRDKNNPNRRMLNVVKGNYLSDDFKNTGIPLVFDGETLTFSTMKLEANDTQPTMRFDTRGIDADEPIYIRWRKKPGRKHKLTNTDLPAIEQMRKSGMTLQQIGEAYEVDKGTVSRFCKKHSVEK